MICAHGVDQDDDECEYCAEDNTCRHGLRVDKIECEECADEESGDIPGTGEDEDYDEE